MYSFFPLKQIASVSLCQNVGGCDYTKTMASYSKEMKLIIKLAIQQGWEVSLSNKGHYKFVSPDKSQPVIYLSGTPSDHKTYICGVAQLRRHGLPVPKK
jgi:hypothetical protein